MYVVKDNRYMTSFYSFIYDFQFQKMNILQQISCENKFIKYLI